MSYVPALRLRGPLWLSAVVVLVAGCQALVGDLPEPAEVTGSGGDVSDGGKPGSGGKGGSGGGGATDGGGGSSPESGGVPNSGGAGGNGTGGASVGGTSVDPPDGGDGGDASGGDGGVTGSGGAASGGSGGAGTGGATGGVVGSGGATGGAGGATGGATGGTGGKGTGGSVTCTVDVDQDGYISKACGGPDCDDSDEFVRPNQTGYFDKASKGGIYDYNCNNSIELDPALNKNTVCSGLTIAGGCNKPEAFLGSAPPGCGIAMDWGTCKNGLLGALTCTDAPRTQVKMACK